MELSENLLLFVLAIAHFMPISNATESNDESIIKKRFTRATAVSNKSSLWPNAEIPYEMDTKFTPEQKCHIRRAMYHIMWYSCIRFREKSINDNYFVRIEANQKEICSTSSIGFTKQISQIFLPAGCFNSIGSIVHELMHIIGFYHEHSRHDRDEFVKVNYENIEDYARNTYDINEAKNEQILTPFDFNSIMLGGDYDFTANGELTMESKLPQFKIMNGADDKSSMTEDDAEGLNKLYSCPNQLNLSMNFIRQFTEFHIFCANKKVPPLTKVKHKTFWDLIGDALIVIFLA